ncbi:hypothetical protein LUZ61_016280 [Rhynchospora tenuis]|uniref:BED-type domain-containing protein n=1 Tax=Rhynchospora tenuis TaxID=198213 RepID=A0AAD5Z596_9POAL|nr:hypothetical protein LUZ61_016280 [Rhynchospora tenuis]
MADPGSDVFEPDLVLEAEDDDQLDPTYIPDPEDIERIQNDAINADNVANDVTQAPPAANKKKRKFNKDLKAEVWKYFTKGVEQDDGSYTAVCNYCEEVYQMGNSRGTGSLRHHYRSGCKKMPRNSRDKLQKMLNMTNVAGETKVVIWKFDQALCRKNFAIMVIVHEAFSLVLDNASSNDGCIRELLSGPMSDNLPMNGEVFHQRCGCHILNLVVDAGLSVVGDQISKVRETMKFLRHSQARMERFQLASSQAKVPFKKPAWDVATRWNSTFLMLELALYLRPAIDRYCTLDKNYTKSMQLNNNDWLGMEALMDCLKVFYGATLKFSGTNQASGASSSGTGSSTVNDIRAGLKSLLAEKNTAEPLKSELEQYLTEPLDATALDASFDILAWWKLKVTVYLVMARLARDILAVPASTVASESTFSTSGRTLSTVRNSLNNESLQALICAQDWLRCKVPGGEVGATATLWASAEATLDDTICGSHQA